MELALNETRDTSEALRQKIKLWRKDFPLFAKERLKILDKTGKLVPFVLNDAQWIFHEAVEKQNAEKGFVRAYVLKGRRQGLSTYIAARYYWKTCLNFGRKVYILSHETKTTSTLFRIVERYCKFDPLVPEIGQNNSQMLSFPNLEATYTVATSGAKETGRGDEINLFHGSEVAFWENPENHFAASLQCVALLPNTEIILESTSDGPKGKFFEGYTEAKNEEDLYIPVFIPWHVQKEYYLAPDKPFTLSNDSPEEDQPSEIDIAKRYDLNDGQMLWRRIKVKELGLSKFNREFPSCEDDAWTDSQVDRFIKSASVFKAINRDIEASGPKIMGVDPAGGGGDRFAVAIRQGNVVTKILYRNKINSLEATAWLKELIETEKPDRVNIDNGNIGQAIVTNLRALGPPFNDLIRAINFGSPSQLKLANKDKIGPKNRRAEMYTRLKEWLEDPEGCASLPNNSELVSDLAVVKMDLKPSGDYYLKSKLELKREGIRSTDLSDAVVLTFASNEYFPNYKEKIEKISGYTPTTSINYEGDIHGPNSWMI